MYVTPDRETAMLNRLFASANAPIRYLVIPKCGCTFIKNFIWEVESSLPHPEPMRIHDADSQFLRAGELGLTLNDIVNEGMSFTAIRNPVDRFFSLYKDKLLGEGHLRFDPLREVLEEKYAFSVDPATDEDHYTNCRILIAWIKLNLRTEVDLKKNPHWTPQSYRKNILEAFKLRILLVDDLTAHLKCLFRDHVSHIDEMLDKAERNRSSGSFDIERILDKDLRRKINDVYAWDRRIYRKAREAWAMLDPAKSGPEEIPRFDIGWLRR